LRAFIRCRNHQYDLTISAESYGTIIGNKNDMHIDAVAYAMWTIGSFKGASVAAVNLPSPSLNE
jgi:hypothetical protein